MPWVGRARHHARVLPSINVSSAQNGHSTSALVETGARAPKLVALELESLRHVLTAGVPRVSVIARPESDGPGI